MNHPALLPFLEQIARGEITAQQAASQLQWSSPPASAESLLNLDLERQQRCGFPEAIYAPGKPPALIVQAFTRQHQAGQHALATRVTPEQAAAVQTAFPQAISVPLANTVRLMAAPQPTAQTSEQPGSPSAAQPISRPLEIPILTAGSTDAPVAEEAAETLRWMGQAARVIYDVGVAGPHRLLERVQDLQQAPVIIVVAGMEGALPSVVGGWVKCPVVSVPTSVGYGANLAGFSALLSMLNSCAANVCVVNIDAGFKAGFIAGLIASRTG